ncbi:SDR family NAD(P)-dependent oxidoreductase [Nocardia sp. NPDC057663]|uniref:SDR family NAD(P)-dependent oxidoreductase n=1 Tax=Nocardia sp. NPDC057663 TaxID=3346201 RepID=UPI0036732AA8
MKISKRSAGHARWNRALVTGASAGIGAAFARCLASQGVDLVLVARDEARLQSLAEELLVRHNVAVEVLPADLSDTQSLQVVERRLAADPFIDLLVNNAGIGTFGAFSSTDLDDEIRTIDVNVIAPLRLSRRALDRMRSEDRGSIVSVSSLDGLQPTPYHSVYGATKAFVNSFSGALHEEIRDSAITVTTVMPGYVGTEFTAHAGVEGALDGVPNWLVLSPERVATDALADAAVGKALSVPGRHYKISAAMLGVLPQRFGRKIFAALAPQH